MNSFVIRGKVKRFSGKYGWYYVELDRALSEELRPLLTGSWPAFLKARFNINKTSWRSSIMPIKNGLLFIAIPAKIRKSEGISENSDVEIVFTIEE
jgi:hypothetical protein